MRKVKLFSILFLLLASIVSVQAGQLRREVVPLYAGKLTVYYDEDIVFDFPARFDERSTLNFFIAAKEQDMRPLLATLKHEKELLHLNDWMYYQFVKNTVDVIYNTKNLNYRVMMQWYLMHNSGYYVKLYHDNLRPFLYAAVEEKVFGMSYIDLPEGKFCEISSQHYRNYAGDSRIYTNTLIPVNDDGRVFEFAIHELPDIFPTDEIEKKLSFVYGGEYHELNVRGNKALIAFQRLYPQLGLLSYIDIPVSQSLEESFYTSFRELLKGKSEYEAVRMILSFTRQALEYKSDNDAYAEGNLNFSPEMTLLAPYSDCEDRAILFANMVKKLLGKESILLEFPSHIVTAVKFSHPYGKTVEYNGETYTICEPTGPADELEVGELSALVAARPFKVYRQ